MLLSGPFDSSDDIICSWKISVPLDDTIHLRFIDFNLENSLNCEIASLQVYDGPSALSSTFGSKLCGEILPDNIESTGNNMFLIYKKSSEAGRVNEFRIKVDEIGIFVYFLN